MKYLFLFVLVINVMLGIVWLRLQYTHRSLISSSQRASATPQVYPEVEQIKSIDQSFASLSNFFSQLAKAKGGVYAYEVLKRAELPPNTDLHLLGHVVGDELFKQKGMEGIQYCTQDFRNACSHSIVVGLFLQEGESALDKIANVCRRAPGGKGAYTMCFHGLGHGVLAYTKYNFPLALQMCKKTGTAEFGYQEYIECAGGATMEMVIGSHDPAAWQAATLKYFKKNDPLYPCDASWMAPELQPICYTYLTPHLFLAVGADLNNPTPTDYEKAFQFCHRIADTNLRDICSAGFGKEFIGLAIERDFRKFGQMSPDQAKQVYDWCALAHHRDEVSACIQASVSSLYWGGENDQHVAMSFCKQIADKGFRDDCFTNLVSSMLYFVTDPTYRKNFCQGIPQEYQAKCQIS